MLIAISYIARLQRIPDNDADYVDPLDMLAELRSDKSGADREHARDAGYVRRREKIADAWKRYRRAWNANG